MILLLFLCMSCDHACYFTVRDPRGNLVHSSGGVPTSIKYKVERDERYLPYMELGRWLCSHFQLETPLNFHKPITQKLYNLEKYILDHWIP